MRTINITWRDLAKGYRLATQLEQDLQIHLTRSLKAAQRRKEARKLTGRIVDAPSIDIIQQWWQQITLVPPKLEEKAGDRGEWHLLSVLRSKLPDTYCALTNVLVDKRLDADVIVVGPSGIWVLESKYWSGKITNHLGQWHQTKTYHQPGGMLVSEDKKAPAFDLQWRREMDAVMKCITARFPQFGLDIDGGLAFTQPNVKLDIDDTSQAKHHTAEEWAEQILSRAAIPDLSTQIQLQIVDALIQSHDYFDEGREARSSAFDAAQTLHDIIVQKAKMFVAEYC
jgi:hypothetical protein